MVVNRVPEDFEKEFEKSVEDLFGCDDSPIDDGSVTYKHKIRKKIHEKHAH